ncbi:unnamed protein product [Phytophthora fragariaefolia]|uniref:Unnamed protein product n=1 Tax=Phytophthora fragariaefolia TaxID=1490495 RepID=A0A9W6X4R5_9STRA|nr:unnamed protein product [Phytophthora fragariaefolia]
MSAVELPLVPSARSSSSSATSSRSHLHSAGSINSEKSARSVRSQRSQYQQENEEGDGNESFQSSEEALHEDEEPQESSGGLWDEVEHFLSKPSPSLSTLSGKMPKATTNKPPKSTLPTLNVRRSSSDNQSSSGRPARAIAVASSGPKTIDPKLLQDAFDYAKQLQQMNFDDDDGDTEDQQQSWRSNKAKMTTQRASRAGGMKNPSNASTDSRKKKGKAASSSAYSSTVKPKSTLKKKRSTAEDSPPNASADYKSRTKSKGHMDPQTLQALVSNFQNGTTLDELRRELAASQQSMAMSRQVLQEAAQNFFQSH